MAISPRSRGLGNIGNIVNRQNMAAPTRPQPQVVQRPRVAAPMVQRPMPVSSPMTQPAKLNPMVEWARNHPTNPSAPGLPDGQTTPPTGTIPQDFYDPVFNYGDLPGRGAIEASQQGLGFNVNPFSNISSINGMPTQQGIDQMFNQPAQSGGMIRNFGPMSNNFGPIGNNFANMDNSLNDPLNPQGTTNNSSGSLFGGGGFANY